MADEWGDWIEHDGRGCPLPAGTAVQVQWNDGSIEAGVIAVDVLTVPIGKTSCWHWAFWYAETFREYAYVENYRIRKPKALADLKGMIADLPETVDA